MMKFFGSLGKSFLQTLDYYGGVISLTYYSLLEFFKTHTRNQRRLFYINTIKQIFFTAYQGIKNVFFVSILISAITSFILFVNLSGLVSKEIVADIFIIVIFREILPIVVMVIIIARSVSAITVEIGNMTVNKEFDIFVSLGIDPLFFLVLPRVVGMVVSLVILMIFSSFVVLFLGTASIVIFSDIDIEGLLNVTFSKIGIRDLILVNLKGIVTGFFLPSIAMYHGFKTQSRNLVPVSATRSIIASLTFAMITSIIITVIFYIFAF